MKIHFTGIGGISMSALATILFSRGHTVTGSDLTVSDATKKLAALGIEVTAGHGRRDFNGYDMLVYTQAVGADNPELFAARGAGVPILERADLLGLLAREYDTVVAIAGSHGKTTAASMTAACMLPLDPTVHIGGNSKALNGNFRIGSKKFFITEACEYKRSFIHIRPDIAVVLNIDADHLDYYRDIDDVADAFYRFCKNVPKESGLIVVYGGDVRAAEIARKHGARVLTVGYDNADVRAENIVMDEKGACSFDVCFPGLSAARISLKIPGKHNILNALAAIAVSLSAGADISGVKAALEEFEGALRRWQTLGETNGARVVADYAHHPKEISAALELARNTHPERLITVFQPHTYSRTQKLWSDFIDTLAVSDTVILTPVYAARETPVRGVTGESLAYAVRRKNPNTYFAGNFRELSRMIKNISAPGDLVLFLGAGDIIEAGESLVRER